MLDYTIFGYLDKCLLLNDVLARYFGCFLRFYEKRNKYRYQLRKKLKSKNEIHSEISSCVQQKFNGYDFLIEELRNYEKKNLVPHDIVYEPPKNTETPIYCFFATKIYMVYATFYSLGDKIVKSHTIQQCPYCEKFFRKTKDALSKHIKCCAGQSGYTYEFDNSIVNYQENFNKIGDLPFAIYYDFETTTGSGIFHDAKMYIVSYCIVVAFHPDLKIPHMVIYRSFDQSLAEVESLQHFIDLKKDFFSYGYHNLKTLKQLGDCALSVFNKLINTALVEMLNVELKFVCNSLKNWFATEIKSVEIDED